MKKTRSRKSRDTVPLNNPTNYGSCFFMDAAQLMSPEALGVWLVKPNGGFFHNFILHLCANQRPYLINFDATGSPCHELTSWDNSRSMSI